VKLTSAKGQSGLVRAAACEVRLWHKADIYTEDKKSPLLGMRTSPLGKVETLGSWLRGCDHAEKTVMSPM